MGEKYKTEELVPIWMQTETGIYETFVITDRKLLDQTVVTSLEKLIMRLRAGTLPSLTDDAEIHYEVGQEEDLVIENIRRRWELYFEDEWRPPKDKLIGVLRTILGSIETMRSPSPRSQSYMRHIAGFSSPACSCSFVAPSPICVDSHLGDTGSRRSQPMAKDRRSRDQKRKNKLAKRNRKARQSVLAFLLIRGTFANMRR